MVALFAAGRISGLTAPGTIDSLVQLLLLVPASICFGIWTAGRLKFDLAKRFMDLLKGIPSGTFLAVALVILAAFCVFTAYGPLQGIPRGPDEAAYFFQSKIFAAGRLAAPAPELSSPSALFPFRHFVFDQGRWFIVYTPLHALLMAPFTAAGAAPLLGPLEGLASLLGIYLLARLWAGEALARITLILTLLSPFFLFMSSTFMAHNTNLMLITWSLYMFSRSCRGGGKPFSLAGGFLIGLAFMTKPYPVLVWLAYVPLAVFSVRRSEWKSVLLPGLAAAAVPMAAFLLANEYYTGSPFDTGYDMVRGGKLIGFGPRMAWFPVYGDLAHTPARGLLNLARQIGSGSRMLLGWPFLSLVPMLFALRRAREDRRVLWLYLPPFMIMVLMWLHYYPAVDYGPRHYFTLMPLLAFLSALGLSEAVRMGRERKGIRGSNMVTATVGCLVLMNIAISIPDGISERAGIWHTIDDMPRRVCRGRVQTPAVVFMQAGELGYPNICSGINFDSPFLDGEVIYCAHQTTAEDLEFMETCPERNAYIYWLDDHGFNVREWTPGLSGEIEPSREMEYRTYLHLPDTTETYE